MKKKCFDEFETAVTLLTYICSGREKHVLYIYINAQDTFCLKFKAQAVTFL